MKSLLYCGTYFVLMTFVASQNPIFTCDPATDCKAALAVAGSKVPDPNDCEKYYVCITLSGGLVPSTSSVKCNDGQYFDLMTEQCADELTPGTCGPNTCPIYICNSKCPPYVEITFVADKYDCSSYYICLQTGPVSVTCSLSTPYYDGLTSTCVADASKCCDFCTAYCQTAGTQIVDPCDCTSYYICLAVGTPQENYRFSCAPGTFYDETTATCQSGTCINICSSCGSVNPNPTTSAPTTASQPIETTSTTTSTTTSGVTTTTTPIAGCNSLESFVCPNNGNYQICPYCYKYFFHCADGAATVGACEENTLFNPNEEYPYCLTPSNCPYP